MLAPFVELFPVGEKENEKHRYSNEFVRLKLIIIMAAAADISLANSKICLSVLVYVFSIKMIGNTI